MFLASWLEALAWTGVYLAFKYPGELREGPLLLYGDIFHAGSTLGYGDVVRHDRWRQLSAFESANGIIMFGWTTAIVIAAIQRIYAVGEKTDR